MARATHIQTSFNGGEFSDRMAGRVDLQRYASSAKELNNFLPTVAGPAEKRPGTHFVGEAIDENSRLVRFEYNTDQAYVIEFNEGRCRFYRNGGVVLEDAHVLDSITPGATTTFETDVAHEFLDGDTIFVSGVDGTLGPRINNRTFAVTVTGADTFTIAFDSTGLTATGTVGTIARVYELHTPIPVTDVPNLTYAQSADVLYLAGMAGEEPDGVKLNGSGHPLKLLRFGDDDWVCTEARGLLLGSPIELADVILDAGGLQVVTATAHGLAVNDVVLFTRVQGTRELNGLRLFVSTVDDDVTISLSPADGASVDSSGWHPFGGGGKVASTGFLQRVQSWAWPALAPENSNEAHKIAIVGAIGADFEDTPHVKGAVVRAVSSAPLFTDAMVGSFIRVREIPQEQYPKWEARTDFSDSVVDDLIGAGTLLVGDYVHYEGNVYELTNKNAEAKTGYSPPFHTLEGERQVDHKWEWEFAHQGDGIAEIISVFDEHIATVVVRRRMPETVTLGGSFSSNCATNAASPMVLDTNAGAPGEPDWVDGDAVFLSGFATATEVNGLTVYVNKTGIETFECFYDSALTIPVDATVWGTLGGGGQATGFNNATPRWSIDGWSVEKGYPRTVAIFEDRLWWGGARTLPQTLWGSESGVYESHDTHEEITGAVVFSISDQSMNAIDWLFARRGFVIGTRGGEFVARGQNPDDPISSENLLKPERTTSYGSRSNSTPVQVGTSLLFVQRSGRAIREFTYDTDNVAEFRAPDVSLLAQHLIVDGVKDIAWQAEPHQLLWVVTEAFELRACVFDRTQDVVGWSRHKLGGEFDGAHPEARSVAVIPHPDGDQDQLWLIVQRDGGVSVEYLEKPFREEQDIATDAWYVDAGVEYSGAPALTLTGLDHLEDLEVQVLADGRYVGDFTVNDGAITLLVAASEAKVGLAYGDDAVLVTSRIEAGGGDGPAQGKFKNIRNVVARLFETGSGFFYGRDAETMDRLSMTTDNDPTSTGAVSLITGDTRELELPGDVDDLGRVRFEHREPTPCTITAAIYQLQVEDD